MPTPIIKSVGSAGGRDYPTLAAAWAAIPSNLITADEAWTLELYKDSEFEVTSSQIFTGKTTDATRNITIKCGAGQSFYNDGDVLTNALRYNPANGVAIRAQFESNTVLFAFAQSDLIVDGLQFLNNGSGNGYLVNLAGGASGTFKNCILASPSFVLGNAFLLEQNGNHVINCLGYGQTNSVGFDMRGMSNAAVNSKCIACTIVGTGGTRSDGGIYTNGAGAEIIDCAVFGFANCVDSASGTGGHNATDDSAGFPGSSNVYGLTTASQFESLTATSEDFRTKSGHGMGGGTPATSYTSDLDIVKKARSATTPTRGAWEEGGAGPTLVTYAPTSDASAGGWTTSTASGTLASHIDESSPSDSDYIQSELNPVNDVCEVIFGDLAEPSANTNHTVSYRLKVDGTQTVQVRLIAGDGSTVIATWSHDQTDASSYTTFDQPLDTDEADAWQAAGYANSRLRFTAV